MSLTKSAISLLAGIIAATNTEQGFDYVSENAPAVKQLVEAGLIEVNPTDEGVNEKGERQARATDAGKAYAIDGPAAGATGANGGSSTPRPKLEISLEDGISIPQATRAAPAEKYPFDQMSIGQSFFVPNDQVPSGDAFKTLASTLSGVNARYSEETGEFKPNRKDATKQVPVTRPVRKYEQRRVEENGVKGSRVWRVEV